MCAHVSSPILGTRKHNCRKASIQTTQTPSTTGHRLVAPTPGLASTAGRPSVLITTCDESTLAAAPLNELTAIPLPCSKAADGRPMLIIGWAKPHAAAAAGTAPSQPHGSDVAAGTEMTMPHKAALYAVAGTEVPMPHEAASNAVAAVVDIEVSMPQAAASNIVAAVDKEPSMPHGAASNAAAAAVDTDVSMP